MSTFIEHIVKLTSHRDRDLLELTLSKALIDLLPLERIVIARVVREEGVSRWLDVARLDAKGGGRVIDPQRVDFQTLMKLEDASDRLRCLETRERVEVAWAGPEGPRITLLPLFSDSRQEDAGVLELHSDAALDADSLALVDALRQIYRNMYSLLEYSDRDPLTGLLNRKSLDDAFYSAVLEDLDGILPPMDSVGEQERRHRVPANYWLGSVSIDNYGLISDKHGYAAMQDVLQQVARVMSSTFRTYDRLYHFGGDSYGVLLHCPDEALVLAAFERLRANVEKTRFPLVGRVTVSSGFTTVRADDSPASALENTARAVDFARRGGGNKACSHLGLVRRGFFGPVPVLTEEAAAA
ncbi:GGDEF domain-containing protein [Rhodoferax fermentans]|uniref:diguanylate cyclase n=1 Tax=Rhodoferax fermentans TaxID=28066 RepID=A0A1T1AQC7_RHOFE|nr:GGDEF domain-containing protein [Rhodoferax fermentans]MBK1683555.1 GGDEF domain-containing protein [Rhodoferax fermentans]OOV06301.1 GGDEF domain-containing protein [Rhodoferax fermentans]